MANDISLEWSGDLSITASGDLLVSNGTQNGQERVLRRLMTNSQTATNPVPDYLAHPSYGAGLPAMIGTPAIAATITAIVRQQMQNEAIVSQNPPPTVAVTTNAAGYVYISITYTDSSTGQTSVLTVPMS